MREGNMMHAIVARVAVLVVVFAALVAVLAGCSSEKTDPLRISSDGSPAMQVAAELYARVLTRSGTPATTQDVSTSTDAELLNRAATGDLDLFPAYLGSLAASLTPTPPAATEDDLAADVSRLLPQGLMIGDATSVVSDTAGPMVPVYRSAKLNRGALASLGSLAGQITNADLDALAARVTAGEDPGVVAGDWLANSD